MKAAPVATTVVDWPTVQHGPAAVVPTAAWLAGPEPANAQPSPFRSVNVAVDEPVVGLRMNANWLTSASVPGLYVPSLSGH